MRTARYIYEASVSCSGRLNIILSSYLSQGYHCKDGPFNLVLFAAKSPITSATVLNVGTELFLIFQSHEAFVLNWKMGSSGAKLLEMVLLSPHRPSFKMLLRPA